MLSPHIKSPHRLHLGAPDSFCWCWCCLLVQTHPAPLILCYSPLSSEDPHVLFGCCFSSSCSLNDDCSLWRLSSCPVNSFLAALDVCYSSCSEWGNLGKGLLDMGGSLAFSVPSLSSALQHLWLLLLLSLLPPAVLSNQSAVRSSADAPPTDRYENFPIGWHTQQLKAGPLCVCEA